MVVYNKTFENTVIEKLKTDFEEYEDALHNIQRNMTDLMHPFRKKYYYNFKMKGSYS